MGGLDFGEGIKFEPSKLLKKFEEEKEVNFSYVGRSGKRIAVVRPRLAMVFGDLSADAVQLQMFSLAVIFKEMGYDIEIYAFEDGPVHAFWTSSGFPVNIMADNNELGMAVDWSNYNGILVNKLEPNPLLSRTEADVEPDKLEEKWNFDNVVNFVNTTRKANDSFFSINWVEEKAIEVVAARKRLLEEVLKDRTEQHHDTWDKVYQNVRRSDRLKNELHERDDMELERTGQSLCIYEPYLGEGSWPFLHHT